ncbi:hypothetical protein ACFE04_006140 [Oxalis oulophora]
MKNLVTVHHCFVPKTKEEEEEIERHYAKFEEISKLFPQEKGWISEHIVQYKGFWFEPLYGMNGYMWMLECFKSKPSDILLITNPKSGTTWLKALLFSVMNRTLYDFSSHPLLTHNPHECVPFLELKLFRKTPVGDPENMPNPRILATHVPYSLLPETILSSGCKIVYICRNPKDVFVSMWHFCSKIRVEGLPPISMEEALDLFCKGVSPYGPYWDHALGYWNASLEFPERVLFLKYEDVKEETLFNVKKIAEFLCKPFTAEEETNGVIQEIVKLCSFDSMSNMAVNKNGIYRDNVKNNVFFREGKVGDWKNYLSPKMIERLDGITKQKLNGSSLTL